MPTLTGLSVTISQGTFQIPLSGRATLALDLHYRLDAVSYASYSYESPGFTGELSGYSLDAWGGGNAVLVWRSPPSTLTASGTTTGWGEFQGVLSGYELSASGTQSVWGVATLTYYGAYVVSGLSGANARTALSGYEVAARGTTSPVGRLTAQLPTPTLVATGYGDNLGQLIGVLPTLRTGSVGVLVGTLPRATVSITGGAISVDYEAYCFALFDDERRGMEAFATHYTTFPFDRIVRFNDKHYGVAADGLYELTGDEFDGAPIVSVVRTHPTDFRARELKRPVSLYLGGRVGADFRVSVIDSETDTNAYNYRPVDKTGARNYRAFFGKGIRARYLAYAMTNTNGGDFELDDVTPEFVVLRRTA